MPNHKIISFLTTTLFMTSACSEQSRDSEQKSIIESIDMEIINPSAYATASPANWAGALMTGVVDPENPNAVFWNPGCSSFQIDDHHVLTAAHCVSGRQVFNAKWRSDDDNSEAFEVVPFAGKTRMVFKGKMLENSESELSLDDELRLVKIDRENDFAMLESTKILSRSSPVLASKRLEVGEKVTLWAYPNGMPLMRSFNCKVLLADESTGEIRHDCDSLAGSSGGLITNSRDEVAAIHIKSVVTNSFSYYQLHGKFESIDTPNRGNRAIEINKVLNL